MGKGSKRVHLLISGSLPCTMCTPVPVRLAYASLQEFAQQQSPATDEPDRPLPGDKQKGSPVHSAQGTSRLVFPSLLSLADMFAAPCFCYPSLTLLSITGNA